MNVVVFEDAAVAQLGDLVVARPACDLTLGSHTLVEALGHLGHVRRAVRPHLAAHLAGLGGRSSGISDHTIGRNRVHPLATQSGAENVRVSNGAALGCIHVHRLGPQAQHDAGFEMPSMRSHVLGVETQF